MNTLLGVISAAGFIIMVIGLAGLVIARTRGAPSRYGLAAVFMGLSVGLIFSLLSQGLLIVQPQQIAVVFNTLTGELGEPRTSGTHIIVPHIQQAFLYPLEQQEYTTSWQSSAADIRARSIDGQEVEVELTLIYSIDPASVNRLHLRWQNRYQSALIPTIIHGNVRDVIARFRAEDIYGVQRALLENEIRQSIAVRLSDEGLDVTDFLIQNMTFSSQYAEAVERAQITQQEAEQAELRVQQRLQEADQARVTAEGQRDAAITRAEGEAQTILIRAQALATALSLVSEQIAANPQLIQYRYLRNLPEDVRLILMPESSTVTPTPVDQRP